MATLFLQYPACSTCQKAKKWLTENNIEFTNRLIVEENPTVEELKAWIPRSGLPVKKFFNTSGLVYKELKLSEKLPAMSEEEQIALLATNGKLVKRPSVVTDSFLIGFVRVICSGISSQLVSPSALHRPAALCRERDCY